MTGNLHRRALFLAAAAAIATPAAAQGTWPGATVRIIVPFSPGGGTDVVGRLLAPKLAAHTGAAFVVENRPGAAATVGAALVAKAAPDGGMLLISAPEMSIHPSMRAKLPYEPLKDFACVSQLTSGQFVLAAHPSVPVRTVKQLIALAKAKPGVLNYGSSGPGGINHLSGELLQIMTGIRWTHVPFKGSGASVVGLMTGEIDFVFGSTASLVGPSKSGRVHAIAVTGPRRFAELPDVPTIAESGVPGFSVTGWYGLYAPAATPPAIVGRIHAEARRALFLPDVKEALAKTGNEPVGSSPSEFTAFLRAETGKWAKVIAEGRIPRVD
ncbi:MAG: tripartite tricarboxylate transporter substrate binding protein [Burkholderiales bacterium]|nr:tripartite tricarboxylate transporter substrate binding protein [Burkholderiales bacterium]